MPGGCVGEIHGRTSALASPWGPQGWRQTLPRVCQSLGRPPRSWGAEVLEAGWSWVQGGHERSRRGPEHQAGQGAPREHGSQGQGGWVKNAASHLPGSLPSCLARTGGEGGWWAPGTDCTAGGLRPDLVLLLSCVGREPRPTFHAPVFYLCCPGSGAVREAW